MIFVILIHRHLRVQRHFSMTFCEMNRFAKKYNIEQREKQLSAF